MKYRLALLLLCCSCVLAGQQFHFNPQPFVPESDVRLVNMIYQTSDDLIWLGTNQGLYSFDGRTYVPRPRPDREAVKPTAMAEDQFGALWIGYEDGYVEVRSAARNAPTLPGDSLMGAAVTGIVFDPAARIFIATYGKGLWTWSDKQWSHVQDGKLAQIQDIYDVLLDHHGDVWLATDEGIWIYRPGAGSPLEHIGRDDGLPDEIVTQLEGDGADGVWVGSYDAGLANIHREDQAYIVRSELEPKISDATVFASGGPGVLWVGEDRKVLRYRAEGSAEPVALPEDLEDRLSALMVDHTGNLWLAAGNKLFIADPGLSYFKPTVSGIQAIAMSGERVWLGCESGLYEMNIRTHEVEGRLQNQHINVISLFADATGLIWIGTFGQGLYCLDPKNNHYQRWTERDGLTNGSILNIDGFGNNVFLATLGGITSIHWKGNPINGPVVVTDFFKEYSFPPGYVYDVFVDADHQVWFGTDGKGLFKWASNSFSPFAIPDFRKDGEDVSLKTIYSITQDPDKNMWVSGENGHVVCFSPSGEWLKDYQHAKGMVNTLALSSADEIMKINDGSISLIRNNGMNEYLDQNAGLEHFSPSINSVCKGPDGSVWIGDVATVWRYAPMPRDSHYHVHLHIEHIYPSALHGLSDIRLKPDSNFLDVRFSGLWYKDHSRIRYRYKLEGHDPDWIYTREGRAVYSRLAPGTYTLYIESSIQEDFSLSDVYIRKFTVVPPVYKRWWFILGWILFAILGLVMYILSRIRRINQGHAHEREKTMLKLHAIQAQVNPHFLFNSFNTLAGIIEEDQEAAVDYVDQLSAFFRDVLMHRNAELIQLHEEMEMVRHYAFLLQKRYGSNLLVTEHIRHTEGWIAPLSIQLLVENAIKHNVVSADKPLHVSIILEKDWVSVMNPIQPKFSDAQESTGFGLSSLVARYQYLTREKVVIEDNNKTFTVRIPVIHKA